MFKRTVVLLLIALLFVACRQEAVEELTQTTYALGTVITINLYDQGDEALMQALIQRLGEIETLMSAQKEESELSEITSQAGIAPVQVSSETYEVINRAIYYAEISDGKFDPTIGPIVSLWGIGTEGAKVPTQEEIDTALELVDYEKIVLNDEGLTVYLPVDGMSIDLGGIAKGYAADELVELLEAANIERAMINLGGNIYAYGEKENGAPYKVAIQTPYDTRNTYFGYTELKNATVVTSGPYERYFEEDGIIYHHIFDAHTGYPVQSDVASVSIVAETSMDADALSTVLFTMTPADGLALIESMAGIDCIYVDKSYKLTLSSGLVSTFVLTDERYEIQ